MKKKADGISADAVCFCLQRGFKPLPGDFLVIRLSNQLGYDIIGRRKESDR